MKKILVVYNPQIAGCQAYRLLYPYNELREKNIEIDFCVGIDEFTQSEIKDYGIVIFHKDFVKIEELKYLRTLGIKTVVDFDDYWLLSNRHILFNIYKQTKNTQNFIDIIRNSDYVTTTTERLAGKIKEYNKNVLIFSNVINWNLPQFIINREPKNKKIMFFGYLGGITHLDDVRLLCNILPELERNFKDKQQQNESVLQHLVYLFGFDEKNKISIDYADIITNNKRFIKNFRAVQPLNVYNYPTFYNDIDVALAPLEYDFFNSMKSELKIIEAGIMQKCIIASNVFPYKNHIKHGFNGLLASNSKDFGKLAKFCVNNPEKVKEMSENLNKYVKENFNYKEVTNKRIEFLKSI